jgi:hypothetical protein
MLRDQLNDMNKAMRLQKEVPWIDPLQISLKLLSFHLQHTTLYSPHPPPAYFPIFPSNI